MLESLEQVNIKRMNVEKPEQRFYFDPAKEFSLTDWQEMSEFISTSVRKAEGARRFAWDLKLAQDLKIMSPDLELDLPVSLEELVKRFEGILKEGSSFMEERIVQGIAVFKYFNPKFPVEKYEEKIVQLCEKKRRTPRQEDFTSAVADAKRIGIDISVSEQERDSMIDYYHRHLSSYSNWQNATLASNLAYLFSDKFELSQEEYDSMHQELKKAQQSKEFDKVLGIGGRLVELTKSNRPDDFKPEIPEQKQF